VAQTGKCNHHHTLNQQLARWVLLSLGRLEGRDLVMTQELIANMFGMRREGVNDGAHKLGVPVSFVTRGDVSRDRIARI
jgi:hypothetical protein